jgi:hypothetical protein
MQLDTVAEFAAERVAELLNGILIVGEGLELL